MEGEGEGGRTCVKGDNVRKDVSHKHARKQKKYPGKLYNKEEFQEESFFCCVAQALEHNAPGNQIGPDLSGFCKSLNTWFCHWV